MCFIHEKPSGMLWRYCHFVCSFSICLVLLLSAPTEASYNLKFGHRCSFYNKANTYRDSAHPIFVYSHLVWSDPQRTGSLNSSSNSLASGEEKLRTVGHLWSSLGWSQSSFQSQAVPEWTGHWFSWTLALCQAWNQFLFWSYTLSTRELYLPNYYCRNLCYLDIIDWVA